MVQGQGVVVQGPDRAQCLKPEFSLRPGVGEQQRALRGQHTVQHLRQLPQAKVPSPGKTLDLGRQCRVDDQPPVLGCLNQGAADTRAKQDLHGLVQIAQRRRNAPDFEPRIQLAQPRQTQLQSHATPAAKQLMPFIDNDRIQFRQRGLLIGMREPQRQALGCGDQRKRRALALTGAGAAAGVGGS